MPIIDYSLAGGPTAAETVEPVEPTVEIDPSVINERLRPRRTPAAGDGESSSSITVAAGKQPAQPTAACKNQIDHMQALLTTQKFNNTMAHEWA
ncbi:hypothetical protein MY11210_006528 [Beauveria gryllotalpidicola]